MTISINNISSDACLICHMDYTSAEREDTTKVVELACHHFYHLNCLAPWLALNEKENQDLSCCYQCESASIPKKSRLEIINTEVVERRFAEIQQNKNCISLSNIIDDVEKLKPHSNSIANLLNDQIKTQCSQESSERFKKWIIENIPEDFRSMACYLIYEVLENRKTLRSLQQEINHLAAIPITKWSTEIKEEGIPVYYRKGDNEFRMRVSSDYLQRATCAYLYESIHNIEEFEDNLAALGEVYDHDQQVVEAIEDTRNLHKTISDMIQEKASLPIGEVLLIIKQLVNKTQVSENSKQTIPLIIRKILFRYGALRTLNEEIDRWMKEPIEKLPAKLKENGIYYLDKENTVKHLNAENFMGWIKASHRAKKLLAFAHEIKASVIRNTVGFIATQFFNSPR